MAKLNKILWTTDGSKEAGAALSYAKLFAKIFNSEIIGLHVIEVIDKKFWGLLGERLDLTGWDKEGIVNISNILVPLDISEKVSSALNYAIDLAERINANISVLYVLRLEA